MGQCLRQGQRLLTPLHGLRWEPQAPQGVSHCGQTHHPRSPAMAERQGLLRRRVGEGDRLIEVRPGRGVVTQVEQGHPEDIVCYQAMYRVGRVLRQPEELFPNLQRRR